MTERRVILQMGMGTDAHGRDYTRAAARAVEDALGHAALSILEAMDLPPEDLRVQVTVGVQDPDAVESAALAWLIPHGRTEVRVVPGGLDVTHPDNGAVTVIAQAAIEAFLPAPPGQAARR